MKINSIIELFGNILIKAKKFIIGGNNSEINIGNDGDTINLNNPNVSYNFPEDISMTELSLTREGLDNDNIFKKCIYKRKDNTIYFISELIYDDKTHKYIKRTEKYYDKTGTNIIRTLTYEIKYNSHNVVISETLV